MDNLQNWAKQKLQQRQVKDVDEAIVVAEFLNNFRTEATKENDNKIKPAKVGGDHGYCDKGKQAGATCRDFKGEGNRSSHWRDKYNGWKKAAGPHNGCYLCKYPSHGYKDCPYLGKTWCLDCNIKETSTSWCTSRWSCLREERRCSSGHMMLGALLTKKPSLKQVAQ